jgi:hypothetical protein
MITASLRASATLAFFIPVRLASFGVRDARPVYLDKRAAIISGALPGNVVSLVRLRRAAARSRHSQRKP